MAQIKVYGLGEHLNPLKAQLSQVIHSVMVDVVGLPENKKFQRYFPMETDDFLFPSDRSAAYIIIEISMFEGRTDQVKKELIQQLFTRMNEQLKLSPNDVEITIFETPRSHWGIRGLPGDELDLSYKVEV
ncbi:tautomerase family protein [Paenibacillus taichungensis]|uniref:Tautomerase family protein n=1 Tax=Paenibacillus taichungensis TaxID=484184 RepID=A0ABX2MPU4_9BACL|nr:tautomerase family protein [Paenibacillus taichungensis]NUU56082.1 tautomerase family protein [Paenibacillus taichungensis]